MPRPFNLDDVDLDRYDEGEAYYAIGRNVDPNGNVHYFHGPVPPRGERRLGPDRENPFGHGHFDGWHRGVDAGGRRGHNRGYRHGARDGFVGEGRRARDVGYEDGWWGGDRHGMEEAYDDYFGNFDPRVPTGYEYDYGVLNMMEPYGYDDRGYGYGDRGYGYDDMGYGHGYGGIYDDRYDGFD